MLDADGEPKILDFGSRSCSRPTTRLATSSSTSRPKPRRRRKAPARDAGVHVAGASEGQAGRRSLGSLLARQRPLRGADRQTPVYGETSFETLASVMRDEPPAVRGVTPEVPADLAAIVTRCLAKLRPIALRARASSLRRSKGSAALALRALEPARSSASRASLSSAPLWSSLPCAPADRERSSRRPRRPPQRSSRPHPRERRAHAPSVLSSAAAVPSPPAASTPGASPAKSSKAAHPPASSAARPVPSKTRDPLADQE